MNRNLTFGPEKKNCSEDVLSTPSKLSAQNLHALKNLLSSDKAQQHPLYQVIVPNPRSQGVRSGEESSKTNVLTPALAHGNHHKLNALSKGSTKSAFTPIFKGRTANYPGEVSWPKSDQKKAPSDI
jgi:hypothetical protein